MAVFRSFVDRMYAPIAHPLIDGEHLIFYDFTDKGMATLEETILYYLEHESERERIGGQAATLSWRITDRSIA